MSAIAGIYNSNKEPIPLEQISGIMDSFQKYPSDDVQVWYKDHIFLGCHAQWITPESIGEQLPYNDSERQLTITADAIIDNRKELFDLLQVEQDLRKSMPDSQLILLAYCKWGQETPKYLIGDFAFIIWDERNQMLFGARDFSGSRTLYYTLNQNKFAFCTLIKPLLTLPFIKKQLNEQWLAEYLAIPGMHETVEANMTPYLNIEQVPPSHSVTIKNGKLSLAQYVKVEPGPKLKLKTSAEYEEALQHVFQRAVADRTRTTRNVGAHLSGGLDSGSVVGYAAKELQANNKQLHTYSYIPLDGFEDWTPKHRLADETPFIQSTIQYVGNIKPNFMNFEGKSPYSEIDEWLDIYEMPYKFLENSYWFKGVYEQAAKDNNGILLYGARGNWTISWGPALDFQATLMKKMKIIRCYKEMNQFSKNIGANKSRVQTVVKRKAFPRIFDRGQKIDPNEFPLLINPDFAQRMNVNDKIKQHQMDYLSFMLFDIYEARKKHFENLTYWNINGTTGTKLSLRYKLWDRDPTNDLRVINFCLSVPEEQYVKNGIDRLLIRRAAKGYLPDKVRLNQKVRGIQGTDGMKRMEPHWSQFIDEVEKITKDSSISQFLNIPNIKDALVNSREIKNPEFIFDFKFKTMMRSLIVYRFLKQFT